MVTNKRQRQRESREARERAIRARQKKAQRQRFVIIVFTAVVLILGVTAFVVGGGDGDNQTAQSGDSTTVPAAESQPATLTSVPPGASITGDTPCPNTDGTAPRTTQFAKPPPMCINTARTYTADVTTSKGRFTITFDAKAAPGTVNNFVVLARYKYFEGIPFHRIIPNFVVQGGDPTATGTGNPGYKFDDELPKQGAYKVGSVAMANSGANTNGSQFFIITGQAGVALPPSYSLFGEVTDGLDIVKSIEAVGTQAGAPTQAITISSVIVKES